MEYQGHKSRAHWNVALYLYNDEPTYRMVLDACARSQTHENAAKLLLARLGGKGTKTPDGYEYTVDTILAAIDEEKLAPAR